MDTDNETGTGTEKETGKIPKFKSASLVANVRDALLQARRSQVKSTTWSNMSEAEQGQEIADMTNLAHDIVRQAVDVVAMTEPTIITARLKTFQVTDGELKFVGTGHATDQAVVKLNQVGGKRLIVTVYDEEKFKEEFEEIEPDPDQPDLIDADATGKDDGLAPAFAPLLDAMKPENGGDTQAYINGEDARIADMALTDDPYPENSPASTQWQAGFHSAGRKSGSEEE